MKILIINPPAEDTLIENQCTKGKAYIDTKDFGFFPPLGALYVLSYLERYTQGHKLFFKDCVAEKISHKKLAATIKEILPDVVGITSFTSSLRDVLRAARTIREVLGGIHICLGGHHPIAFPFQAAMLEEFDSIVVGEGEVAFTELVKALSEGRDFTSIQGVYTVESIKKWKDDSYHDRRFLSNVMVPPAYIDDIDSLPVPNRSFIKHINYQSVVGVSDKLATIISSRGCPYRCTFCDVPYKVYRRRSTEKVVDEIEICLGLGYREFHFYDDLFNITPEKVIEFCGEVQKRGLSFPWSFRGRVNTVTRESLVKAKESGCRLITFGVETGSDEGLKMLNKMTDTSQIRQVFKWCKELKIRTLADYMIGLPFERTREDILKNVDFLLSLKPDYAQFGVLSLYPNTKVYNDAMKKGLIKPEKWEEFALNPFIDFTIDHWEEYLTAEELIKLQQFAYKKFYIRPSYIFNSIINTRTLYEFLTKIKGFIKLLK